MARLSILPYVDARAGQRDGPFSFHEVFKCKKRIAGLASERVRSSRHSVSFYPVCVSTSHGRASNRIKLRSLAQERVYTLIHDFGVFNPLALGER